ncbi:MAG: HD domain-containing protein [Actinobacteria bacterium]|nr:HD domain-containing protein [Actinomycetota bacterium]MCL6087070.1 HD domain-containing protein [Actinomycetota bacterium]
MKKNLKILSLEDDINDFELIKSVILTEIPDCSITLVDTKNDFINALKKSKFDVILADYKLPQFDGISASKISKKLTADTPFIIVTGTIGEERTIEVLKSGITDFVLKDKLARLVPSINRALQEAIHISKRKNAEEALKKSGEKYRNLVDNALVGVYQTTVKGDILFANEALSKILEFKSTREMASVNAASLWKKPADRNYLIEKLNKLGKINNYEIEAITNKGNNKNLLISASLENNIISGMVDDITERKKNELKIQEQNKRLNALRNIDLAITSSLDIRVTLNVFLDNVAEQLKIDAVNVLLLNPHTQILEHAASRGFYTDALRYTTLHIGQGYAGLAAQERRIVNISDLTANMNGFKLAPLLESEGFMSYIAAPLIAKGHVMGVLEIFNRTPLVADQEWLDFMEALATQAAIAVENANLFNDLQKSNVELILAYDLTLEGWSKALDIRDKVTEGHTLRVTNITLKVAKEMGITNSEMAHIRRGALLHDIGKLGIPDSILHKPGPLTDEEFKIMQSHPVIAYELISPISFLRNALNIPYCHHEKWDGTGYPRRLKKDQIPLEARIFAVVDVCDALLHDRPYREAWPENKVKEYIQQESGKHFDPKVAEIFLKLNNNFIKKL